MTERTLLMDGDVLAYIAAVGAQREEALEEDGFGYVRPFANLTEAEAILERRINSLMEELGGTSLVVLLSDPTSNWRHEIMPSYKGNRSETSRPLLLGRMKDFLRERFGATHRAAMEADDAISIIATEPQDYPGDRVVVGRDKDFKSIPGKHHVIGSAPGKVDEISEWEADRFHLMQALAGDRIDGYDGCPNIGMERAARIIDDPKLLSPAKGIVTRGPRKGQETVKWVSEPTRDLWQCIVSNYRKEGLKEADALLTARVARILRHEDYDEATDRIILWTPERIVKWMS